MIRELRKLYSLIDHKDKRLFFVLLLMMLLNAFMEAVGIGIIPAILLFITDSTKLKSLPRFGEELYEMYLNHTNNFFIVLFTSITLFFLIKAAYSIWVEYLKGNLVRHVQIKLGNSLMSKYIHAPYSFHLKSELAELVRNVNSEVKTIIEKIVMPGLNFLLQIFMGLSILILLVYTEPLLSLGVLIVYSLISIVFLRLTKNKIQQLGKEVLTIKKLKTKLALDVLNLIKEVKSLGKEGFFMDRYNFRVKREAYITLHQSIFQKIPRALLEVVSVVIMSLLVIILLIQEKNVSELVSILSLFAISAVRLMPVVQITSTSMNSIRYSLPSIDPVFKHLTEISEEKVARSEGHFDHNDLVLTDLFFEYDKGNPTINGINLTIKSGESVGIVGTSGAGKSTLMDLMLSILKPMSGTITYGGVNIHSNLEQWRSSIGYIPQQINLIYDTIKNNICFGIEEKDIDVSRLAQVIEDAQLKDFVDSLDLGLETIVGDRGVRLSGGQRQRIGIARALYRNPTVIFMDEATSALDNVTEKYIIEQIDMMRKNRTVIMIAHRFTTVENCDQIVYMDKGKIAGIGTYRQLFETNLDFNILATSQADMINKG